MVCDKQFNLNTAADTALRPFTAGTFRVCSEHNLVNRLQAYIWLLKTLYATPAGMYASQIWATPYIQQGKEMDSPLQKWLLAVLKGYWGSETPRLHGVSCESVDWNPYSSIGFTRQCGCTFL